jgi:hypothetical protein
MHTRLAVALAILLIIGGALPTYAQQTPPPDTLNRNCEQEMAAVAPQTHGGHATVATVIQVDHQHGLLHLETDIGRVLTFATPKDIEEIHEGDRLVVCIADADPAENPSSDTSGA